MKRLLMIGPLVFAFFLSSCSSTRKGLVDFEKENRQGTFLLMGYQLQGEGAPKKCSIEFETPKGSGIETADFEIYNNARYIFAELLPGEYRVYRIKCGYQHYRVGNFFGVENGRFVVRKNQINYVGDSRLVISKEKELSFQWGQTESLDFLQKIYPRMHESLQRRLANAYTGKSVSQEMLFSTRPSRSFNARYAAEFDGLATQIKQSTDELKAITETCFKEEEKYNPLRLGVLHYELLFRNGGVVKLDQKKEHAYSDGLSFCLEKKFRKMKIASSKELEYVLDL